MNYDAHPSLLLPEGFDKVSMLEGVGSIIKGNQLLLDGWIFEGHVLKLDDLDLILRIHDLSSIPVNMAMIVPDMQTAQSGFWQEYLDRGFKIFPQSTPRRTAMGPEQAYNHFDIRRNLFLSAAGVLQRGQL